MTRILGVAALLAELVVACQAPTTTRGAPAVRRPAVWPARRSSVACKPNCRTRPTIWVCGRGHGAPKHSSLRCTWRSVEREPTLRCLLALRVVTPEDTLDDGGTVRSRSSGLGLLWFNISAPRCCRTAPDTARGGRVGTANEPTRPAATIQGGRRRSSISADTDAIRTCCAAHLSGRIFQRIRLMPCSSSIHV